MGIAGGDLPDVSEVHVEHLGHRSGSPDRGGESLEVVELDSRRVGQEVPDRHGVPDRRGVFGDVLGKPVVQRKGAALDQLQRRDGGEHLPHRADIEPVVDREGVGPVRRPVCFVKQHRVAAGDEDDAREPSGGGVRRQKRGQRFSERDSWNGRTVRRIQRANPPHGEPVPPSDAVRFGLKADPVPDGGSRRPDDRRVERAIHAPCLHRTIETMQVVEAGRRGLDERRLRARCGIPGQQGRAELVFDHVRQEVDRTGVQGGKEGSHRGTELGGWGDRVHNAVRLTRHGLLGGSER